MLINFGTVSRLDLLRDWLRGRGRWTQAVSDEAAASASHVPALLGLAEHGSLGLPSEIGVRTPPEPDPPVRSRAESQ